MMIHCKNCGQMNAKQSNFCRFCGKRFFAPPPPPRTAQPLRQPDTGQSEPKAPKPYSWKTDEFQVKNTGTRPTEQIQDMPFLFESDGQKTRPLPVHRGHGAMVQEYCCPNCGSQALPYAVRKISSAGWIVFAVLLVLFFPLFWVGFLVKEDVYICPACNFKVS